MISKLEELRDEMRNSYATVKLTVIISALLLAIEIGMVDDYVGTCLIKKREYTKLRRERFVK
jgi:hypothetical protein